VPAGGAVKTDSSGPAADRGQNAGTAARLADLLKAPTIDLSLYLIDEAVLRSVPEEIARKFTLVPVFKIGNRLTVAMADPTDVFAIDEIEARTGYAVEPVQAGEAEIEKTLQQFFGGGGSAGGAEGGGSPSAANLVKMLLTRAVKDGASDIHIEPEENAVRIRQRVDGVLMQVMSVPKALEASIVTRVKILGGLDIAEKRLPQDGRIQLVAQGRDVDVRVSVQPTVTGENVVLRILDRETMGLGLEKLGLGSEKLRVFNEAVTRPNGMILVTGPTGSGKTTTLYSALKQISSPELNIMTIEDPVEYKLEGIRQTQVNPTAGYTFANGLRALLRQDPDVMMVGEIRDRETADMAIRSALTGHLVFSTLHTNDAAGAFARLIDMGIEPFLIASSVHCVIAQRLVRLICQKCKRPAQPSQYLLKKLGVGGDAGPFWYGKGCRLCHQTGYRGRAGMFEVLTMSPAVREAVLARQSAQALSDIATAEGMETLRQDGINKALGGETTLEEVLRVTSGGDSAGGFELDEGLGD